MLRVLAVGDVVGKPGRAALAHFLPILRKERGIDFVVVNAENAASGSGITPRLYAQLRELDIDVMTMGDHAYKRRESLPLFDKEQRLLRPANWPVGAPGRGSCIVESSTGVRVGVLHLQGKVFMNAHGDFLAEADRQVEAMKHKTDVILVDMHAEATSEKIALSWHLDGRVALVFGSHTHVPTADAEVRPGGTAYITDCGMTGPYDSVIGRDKNAVIKKMRVNVHEPFTVATRDRRLGAAIVDVDERTGRATAIEGCFLRMPDTDHAP